MATDAEDPKTESPEEKDAEDPKKESPQRSQPKKNSKSTKTSVNLIMTERRKYPGGNDGEGDSDEDATAVSKAEMLRRARVHMKATACTKWDDKEHRYRYLSVFKTSRHQMGVYGIGVQLYFQFLCQMGCVFLVLCLISLPLLLTNLAGDIVEESGSEGTQKVFGQLSVANLGACGPAGSLCSKTEQLQNRKVGFTFTFMGLSPDTAVKGLTPIFGTLDGIGLLVFMSFGLYFLRIWIPRTKRVHDGVHVTPADFTVRVRHLPHSLDHDNHFQYEEHLKEHFVTLLKERCGVEDDDPVHDVTLVRDYDSAVAAHISQGQLLLQKKDLQVRKKAATTEEKQNSLQKRIDALNKRIVRMENSLNAKNSGKTDEERHVCDAFITFEREGYVDKVLHEYRFAKSRIFRCCLEQPLKFHGHNISVEQAGEPSDLFWENMDFPHWARRLRLAGNCLLTLMIILVCLIALIYCRMIGVATQASPPQTDVWVLKTLQSSSCLTLCDWKLYSDQLCLAEGGLGRIVGIWDFNGNASAVNHSSLTACSTDYWSSSACSGGSVQAQWVGVQFSANVNPACMHFEQRASSALSLAELYACSSAVMANLSSAELQNFMPEAHCIGMQDLTPSSAAQGSWSASGRQLVLSDTTCRRTVSYQAATDALQSTVRDIQAADSALTAEDASYKASSTDPTMNCYCRQQQSAMGMTSFRAPPYDSIPEKVLCKDWIYYQNFKLTMMGVGVLAVSIINLTLVFIFSYIVVWERHSTFTRQDSSQFLKLFIAQFMNTALIVLLVNSNWRKSLDNIWIVHALGLGNGTYDDFDSGWYVAIGSGLCLTIAMQVITATTPGIVMSYVVNPIMICFFRMGLVTQKLLNQVHVFPAWDLANRLAQTMTVFCVVLMYSGGMPVLNFFGFIYCILAYWMDKWCLLRGSLKPPSYDATLLQIATHMFPFAAFLHATITLWCFGNQNVFPADWSTLQRFFGGIINMDENRYMALIEQFQVSTEEQRNNIFFEYLHARLLDFARWSCWLLLLIFLVFCVYYLLAFLNAVLFGPILAPFYTYIGGKCSKEVEGKAEETHSFAEKREEMMALGLIPSYSIYANPRYSVVLAHLEDGGKEVEKAKAELEASQSAAVAAKQAQLQETARAEMQAEAAAHAKTGDAAV